MSAQVARSWRGRVPAERGDAYLDYLHATGLRELNATPGNRGTLVLRRELGDVTEFELISFWESAEAMARFAGDDSQRARYYPEDPDYLLELVPSVDVWSIAAGAAALRTGSAAGGGMPSAKGSWIPL